MSNVVQNCRSAIGYAAEAITNLSDGMVTEGRFRWGATEKAVIGLERALREAKAARRSAQTKPEK
jgi:hypothetical protein